MDRSELSGRLPGAEEDLSERSESSNSSCSSAASSGPAHPDAASAPTFHGYKGLEALASGPAAHRFPEYADVPMALDKPKDYAAQRADGYGEAPAPAATGLFRGADAPPKDAHGQKEAMFSFCREIREMRQKSLHAALQERPGPGPPAPRDLELMKTYGLPLERVKDFGELTSRISSIALAGEAASAALEAEELKSLQQLQSRVGGPVDVGLAFERLRHAYPLFQGDSGHFGHSPPQQQQQQPAQAQQQQQQQHAVTQLTQMQHAGSPQQQHHHHHQQQAKSFTIDAILGLRDVVQRDKQRQRQHSYRKHQGQEGAAKALSAAGCANGHGAPGNPGGPSGKLKRVRTIFTVEQLQRLEGEFARQQYMVGPERLYLAHELRLTEAQVKVWFQNRRIKWRKLNHEKQSQRLHELHHSGLSAAERDDSNENAAEW